VVVDPASDWPLFAEKARELIEGRVAVVFGCWTSVSRKSVLPVFEELNGLLFYPVQYEGEESSERLLHRRRAQPAGDPGGRLPDERGGRRRALGAGRHRLRLSAHHQQDPRGLPQGGRASADEDIMINYTPFGHSDWQTIVADIKKFGSAGKKTAVVSTINGDANVPFYKELGNQGIDAEDIPVVAFSVGEEELAGIDTKPLVGHLAAWNYFMSVDTRERRVHRDLARLHRRRGARDQRPDGSPLHRLQHVGEGGREGRHHRPDAVIDAMSA
jgi:urea transport system substrate-binding protein